MRGLSSSSNVSAARAVHDGAERGVGRVARLARPARAPTRTRRYGSGAASSSLSSATVCELRPEDGGESGLLVCRVGGGGEVGRGEAIIFRPGSVLLSTEPWLRGGLRGLDLGVSAAIVVMMATGGSGLALMLCCVGVRRPLVRGAVPVF